MRNLIISVILFIYYLIISMAVNESLINQSAILCHNESENSPNYKMSLSHINLDKSFLSQEINKILNPTSGLSNDNILISLHYNMVTEIDRVYQLIDNEMEKSSHRVNSLLRCMESELLDLDKQLSTIEEGYVDIHVNDGFTTYTDVNSTISIGHKSDTIQDTLTHLFQIHNSNLYVIQELLNYYQSNKKNNLATDDDDDVNNNNNNNINNNNNKKNNNKNNNNDNNNTNNNDNNNSNNNNNNNSNNHNDTFSHLISPTRLQHVYYISPNATHIFSQLQSITTKINNHIDNNNATECISVDIEYAENNQSSSRSSILISAYVIFILLYSISVIVMLCITFSNSKLIVAFRLFRGPMFILAFLYLFSLDIIIWSKSKIDYIKIFEFGRAGKVPSLKFLLNICTAFSAITTVVAMLYIMSAIFEWRYDIVKGIAITLWGIYFGFLFNPTIFCSQSSRYAFSRVLLRILTAPVHTVYFCDFWFADQLNSLVLVLLDFQYFTCYCFFNWNIDFNPATCASHRSFIRPAISCLPALWRLLQCLKNYHDTSDFSHFLNGIKYSTTFPVVILASLVSISQQDSLQDNLYYNPFLYGWIVFGIIHALYTFLWDVYRDWGFSHQVRPYQLRKVRLYKYRIYYWGIVLIDLILRFCWVLKLSLSIQLRVNADLIYTFTAFGELLRRFLWNIFRLEWEQVKSY